MINDIIEVYGAGGALLIAACLVILLGLIYDHRNGWEND